MVNNIMRRCLYIFMVMATSVSAEVYSVSSTNNIQSVVSNLKAGDEMFFSAGEYQHDVILNGVKGEKDKPVVLRGEDGTVIYADRWDGIRLENCEYVTVENITVINGKRAGIIVFASKYIIIKECIIKKGWKWGIQTCLSDFVSVIDCDISGSIREHGIYFSTTDHPVVKNCKVYNNRGCGIHFNGDKSEGGDGMISDGLVSDNIIYGNAVGGGAAINMDSAERMVIKNNKIYGNRAGGITSFCEDGAHAGAGNKIINNSVKFEKGQGRYALQLFNGSTDSIVKDNILVCGRGPALEIDKESLPGLVCKENIFKVIGREESVLVDDEWGMSKRLFTTKNTKNAKKK